MGKLSGVATVKAYDNGHRLHLSGDGLDNAAIYYQIEPICRDHACRILDLSLGRGAAFTFSEKPTAAPLTPADAAVALFPYLLSGRRSRLWYGPWQGNPLALFRTLALRLSRMHCFRLQPGPLSATADLIERIAGESL
ncbi:MAG: hypothetical protein R2873_21515 [Caldilineaceae bacterium]